MKIQRYGQTIVANYKGKEEQPVNAIKWVHRDSLHANIYNPNVVAPPELDLLEISILEDGWTQPIVIKDNGEIVDGFHRWTVSGRERVFAMTEGLVPVVLLGKGKDIQSQMMATIRHNRARGTHGVKPMSNIIVEMVQTLGLTPEEIIERLAMEKEEVNRLFNRTSLIDKYKNDTFNKAWQPSKDGVSSQEIALARKAKLEKSNTKPKE